MAVTAVRTRKALLQIVGDGKIHDVLYARCNGYVMHILKRRTSRVSVHTIMQVEFGNFELAGL